MNVYLLYRDREWVNIKKFFDSKSVVQDLGLKTLYTNAGKDVIFENGNVKKILEQDPYIVDTMSKVMVAPLVSKEEILYRQDVIKDCLQNEDFIKQLYSEAGRVISEWDKLGRKSGYTGRQDLAAWAEKQIHLTALFAGGLKEIKRILRVNTKFFESEGLKSLSERICAQFDDEYEKNIEKLISDVSFYTKESEDKDGNVYIHMPKIAFRGKLGPGLKLENIVLENVDSESIRYRNPKSTIAKIVEFKNSLTPNSFSSKLTPAIEKQVEELEQNIVNYSMSFTRAFIEKFSGFFEQLLLQTAFYRGAVNLRHHMKRTDIVYSFPSVCDNKNLSFIELKEFVMCMEQRVNAVGNTCSILNKQLVIITGANQGGKSTFLRSFGQAQLMTQCGMFTSGDSFVAPVRLNIFSHFRKEEHTDMNHGKFDEELTRLDRITDRLTKDSLIIFNEAFAATNEREGSEICRQVIRALVESGVEVFTVTHLYSYAASELDNPEAVFLRAERLENGERTFRIVPGEPFVTAFGEDLYKKIFKV